MAKCAICGTKIGGILGSSQADEDYYKRAKDIDLTLPVDLCLSCAMEKVRNAENSYKIEQERKKEKELKLKIESIFVSPMPVPENMTDCGLVTGYSILGTGPLTTFASSLTDFLGVESKSYHNKIKESENYAMNMIKFEAVKIECSAIYMIRVNIQEATSGHGMIMVSIYGSAAKNK